MNRVETINRIKDLLSDQAGQYLAYENWSDEFCRMEFRKLRDKIIKKLGRVSLEGMNEAEAEAAGFGKWDEESGLRLAPIWLYPFLKPGDKLECISGEVVTVGEDYTNRDKDGYIDNDHRFGFIAYGVRVA